MSANSEPKDDDCDISPRVGNKLKRLRLEQGRTLEEVAAKAGISAVGLNLIERHLRCPSLANVERVGRVLGHPLPVLVTEVVLEMQAERA